MPESSNPALQLLFHRPRFWARIEEARNLGGLLWPTSLFIVFSTALYGAVIAWWRSPLLAGYVAIKLPVLVIGTTSLVMLLNWMVAAWLGSGLRFRQVVGITYGAMGVACWILLSLVPVTLFFTLSGIEQGGTLTDRTFTHHCLVMIHVILIAMAGVAGNSALLQGLRRIVAPGCSVRRLYWSWVFAFAFVGCQLSWILRPFFGSPHYPVVFLRDNALEGNFYEALLIKVLPNMADYLFSGG